MSREAGVLRSKNAGRRCASRRGARCHGLGIPVERDQPPARRQPREQRARVAAAAEGGVDVDAVGRRSTSASTASFSRTVVCCHGGATAALRSEVLERRRASPAASPRPPGRRGARASQSSKWLPMPSSITSRAMPAAARSSGEISTRDERVDLDVHRVAEEDRASSRSSPSAARRRCRGISPTPGAGRPSGSRAGAW